MTTPLRSATVWLDPESPPVRSAVISGVWGKAPHSDHGIPLVDPIDSITVALEEASDILNQLTHLAFHAGGVAEEDFVATPRARRLSPALQPLTEIISLKRLGADFTMEPVVLDGWFAHSGALYFGYGTFTLGDYMRHVICQRPAEQEFLRLTYRYGSTITASARAAVLYLAHELWLSTNRCSECEECVLPERTTSVAREGISYTLSDPIDFLNSGRTGLPSVDRWVAGVNPSQATRRSSVYDPGAPPGVLRTLQPAVGS